MRAGPILPLVRDRVVERSGARIPTAWVRREMPDAPTKLGAWLVPVDSPITPSPRDAAVLVFAASGDSPAMRESLRHAAAGARVYVVVPSSWPGAGPAPAVLQSKRVLIRRISEVPVDGIHTAGEARIRVGDGVGLRLDPVQARAMRSVFLRLFWHEATDEAWGSAVTPSWRTAAERPFDVPDVPADSPVQLRDVGQPLPTAARGSLVHLRHGEPPSIAPARLWFPAGPDHHDRLSQLAKAGAVIRSSDWLAADLISSSEGTTLLLPGSHRRLLVRTTSAQSTELRQALEARAAWSFEVDLALSGAGSRGAQVWLAGAAAARGIEPRQQIPLTELDPTELRDVERCEPEQWPAPDPLALAVQYTWTVRPPRLPTASTDDPLVERWNNLESEWSRRIEAARTSLGELDAEGGRLERAFSVLAGSILGIKSERQRLLERTEKLAERPPSRLGSAVAAEVLGELAKVEAAIATLRSDLEKTDREGRERAERDRQQLEWQAAVDEAARQIPDLVHALEEAKADAERLRRELEAVVIEIKSADKLDQRDLHVRQSRLVGDERKKKAHVDRLSREVEDLERRKSSPFEFKPPRTPVSRPPGDRPRFVPAASPPALAAPPSEDLPRVGALRSHRGQRLLSITRWEDLEIGEAEASRLKARLVGPERP